jgi:3-keto-disaccharide hydrolase
MRLHPTLLTCVALLLAAAFPARAEEPAQFQPIFNGKDLTGWVNVNTAEDTWRVRDGLLVCTGKPIGVMRSEKQYENFILHIEWRHMKAGGNSGVFVWSEGTVPEGAEIHFRNIQLLELPPGVTTPEQTAPEVKE